MPVSGSGQECLYETDDGPALVGHEIPAASEEELQLGKLYLAGCELAEVGPHAGLIGNDVGIAGIGFGLPTVGVTDPV